MRKSSDDKFLPDEFGVEGPAWADGKIINEAIFCEEFLRKHKILFSGGSFFTTEGRVVDEIPLKRVVFDDLKISGTFSGTQFPFIYIASLFISLRTYVHLYARTQRKRLNLIYIFSALW